MNIYKLRVANDCAFLVESSQSNVYEHSVMFRKDEPVDIKIDLKIADNDGFPIGDYANVYIPVFSKRALNALYELIEKDVHILEWHLNDIPMYGVQVLSKLDCIDWAKSKYRKVTKNLIVFSSYSFVDELIDKDIFKISGDPSVFVTQKFVERVVENDLRGFGFELIYKGSSSV